jgi:hypothetical protein
MPSESRSTVWSRFKEVFSPPKKEDYIIVVPQWYDVIQLGDEKSLSTEARKRLYREKILQIKSSPTPEIARNVGTIMTALDDIGDFMTTAGVGLRLIGRATKVGTFAARGTFTIKQLVDAANEISRAPFKMLSPSKIKEIIAELKKKRIEVTPEELTKLEKRLEKEIPGWKELDELTRKELLEKALKEGDLSKMLKGKAKKRFIENLLGNGSLWKRFKTTIDKKVMRNMPTFGESLEIAQTSDAITGVGLSFGPIIGFIQDLVFGLPRGAKFKFKPILPEWMFPENMSTEAKIQWMQYQDQMAPAYDPTLTYMYASEAMAAAEVLSPVDIVKSIWVGVSAAAQDTYQKTKEAAKAIYKDVRYILFGTPRRTDPALVDVMAEFGIFPETPQGWPGVSVDPYISPQEFAEKAIPHYQRVLGEVRKRLEGTWEGAFVFQCIEDLAYLTLLYFGDEEAPIETTFAPELAVITRAIDYGLEPPIWATNEEYWNWHQYMMSFVSPYGDLPDYEAFRAARKRFFPDAEEYE